jgi:hypothetical protein
VRPAALAFLADAIRSARVIDAARAYPPSGAILIRNSAGMPKVPWGRLCFAVSSVGFFVDMARYLRFSLLPSAAFRNNYFSWGTGYPTAVRYLFAFRSPYCNTVTPPTAVGSHLYV